MNPDAKVLVAVPTMGAMHPNLVAHLVQWGRDFPPNQVSFYFSFKVSPVDRARNDIVRYFLENDAGFTHLLFIDADTIPPVDGLKRLLSHDKAIVSGLTPILRFDDQSKAWETFDNCFTHVEDCPDGTTKTHMAERRTGLQEVYRCGASCVLINREVFEALKKPYYEFLYNEDGTRHTRSEDIHFCDKAREAGFTLWADTEVICRHHKDVVI